MRRVLSVSGSRSEYAEWDLARTCAFCRTLPESSGWQRTSANGPYTSDDSTRTDSCAERLALKCRMRFHQEGWTDSRAVERLRAIPNSIQVPFWEDVFRTVMRLGKVTEMRAKGVDPRIYEDSHAMGLDSLVNTKVWMEQVGMPFHPMHINRQDQGLLLAGAPKIGSGIMLV